MPIDPITDLVHGHAGRDLLGTDPASLPVVDQIIERDRLQLDVGSTASHVRGDHDGAKLSGTLDDLGFPVMLFCVEHLVLDLPSRLELVGEFHWTSRHWWFRRESDAPRRGTS